MVVAGWEAKGAAAMAAVRGLAAVVAAGSAMAGAAAGGKVEEGVVHSAMDGTRDICAQVGAHTEGEGGKAWRDHSLARGRDG